MSDSKPDVMSSTVSMPVSLMMINVLAKVAASINAVLMSSFIEVFALEILHVDDRNAVL